MAKRPNILKLATKISLESLTYTGITYTDPEYRILDPIVTDDMCRVMMHLRLETDRPVGEVAKRCKESEAFVQEQLFEIDVYPFWTDRAIMEIELDSEEREVMLPPFIEVIKEVTGDGRYTNAAIAREVPAE